MDHAHKQLIAEDYLSSLWCPAFPKIVQHFQLDMGLILKWGILKDSFHLKSFIIIQYTVQAGLN